MSETTAASSDQVSEDQISEGQVSEGQDNSTGISEIARRIRQRVAEIAEDSQHHIIIPVENLDFSQLAGLAEQIDKNNPWQVYIQCMEQLEQQMTQYAAEEGSKHDLPVLQTTGGLEYSIADLRKLVLLTNQAARKINDTPSLQEQIKLGQRLLRIPRLNEGQSGFNFRKLIATILKQASNGEITEELLQESMIIYRQQTTGDAEKHPSTMEVVGKIEVAQHDEDREISKIWLQRIQDKANHPLGNMVGSFLARREINRFAKKHPEIFQRNPGLTGKLMNVLVQRTQ